MESLIIIDFSSKTEVYDIGCVKKTKNKKTMPALNILLALSKGLVNGTLEI